MSLGQETTGDEPVDAIMAGLAAVQDELAPHDHRTPDEPDQSVSQTASAGSAPADLDSVLESLTDAHRQLADRLAALD